jgi:hypothetical protein
VSTHLNTFSRQLYRQAKRNVKKGLGPRSLNEILALHLTLIVVLALSWGLTAYVGPRALHEVLRKLCMFYALPGWVAMRVWNQHAWRKHFTPRAKKTVEA